MCVCVFDYKCVLVRVHTYVWLHMCVCVTSVSIPHCIAHNSCDFVCLLLENMTHYLFPRV